MGAISNDILRELSEGELREMLQHLKSHLPRSIRGHHLLYNYLRNLDAIKERSKDKSFSGRWQPTFYGHREGKIENCTYIALSPEKDYWVNLCSVEESGAELLECLKKTKRINWLCTPISISVDVEYYEEFNKIISPKRNDWQYDKPEHIFYISKEKVREFPDPKIPNDLSVVPLPVDCAEMIDDIWEYSYNGSKEVIEASIEINGGTCLMRYNKPITWITTNDFFAPGFLHTIESERRKGYGVAIFTIEMQRIVNEHDIDIFTFLVDGNVPSINLHQKIGFKKVNECRWVVVN